MDGICRSGLVSVLLIVRNGAPYIRACAESVLRQTLPSLELIVVDDASDDGTDAIVRGMQDSRIRYFRRETRRHMVYSMNEALSHARGEWIARIDHDDLWAPDKLEKQIHFMKTHPRTGAVFTYARLIGEHGEEAGDSFPVLHACFHSACGSRREWVRRFFYRGNFLCHSSALVRRTLMEPYDLFLRQLQDFGLWCSLIPKTDFAVIPEELVLYRRVPGSACGSAPTRAHSVRKENERLLVILPRLLDALSPADFVDCFGEDFRCPDSAAPLELEIEKAFLLLGAHPANSRATAPALQRFAQILTHPGAAEMLEEKYGLSLPDLYGLTQESAVKTAAAAREAEALRTELDRTRQALAEAQAALQEVRGGPAAPETAPGDE